MLTRKPEPWVYGWRCYDCLVLVVTRSYEDTCAYGLTHVAVSHQKLVGIHPFPMHYVEQLDGVPVAHIPMDD